MSTGFLGRDQPRRDLEEALNFREDQDVPRVRAHGGHSNAGATLTSSLRARQRSKSLRVFTLSTPSRKSMVWHHYFHFTVQEPEAQSLAQGHTMVRS